MVLYHVFSTYQLLECIEHRLLKHPEETAYLLIHTFMLDKLPNYKELITEGIFNNVYVLDTIPIRNEEQILSDVEKNIETQLPVKFNEFSEIYMAGVHNVLSIYLIENHIRFTMFEDGNGALSRPEVLDEINKKEFSKFQYELFSKYDLFYPCKWDESIVKAKICNINAQKEGFKDNLAVHFDIVESFSQIPEPFQKKILEIFHCPHNIPATKDSILLLTQHFCNLNQLTFEEHILIYQTLFDYFFQRRQILIKPHPDDIMFYDKLFPEAKIIREKFPSELLPFIFDVSPETLSTISSTGIYLIEQCFQKHLYFSAVYEKYFYSIHKYYVAIKLIEYLGFSGFSTTDVLQCLVNNFIDFGIFNVQIRENDSVFLIDDIDTEDSDSIKFINLEADDALNKMYIFINSNSTFNFYQYGKDEIFDNLIPIVIKKSADKEEIYCNLNDEYIYIYTPDKNLQKKILNFSMEHQLLHTGIHISVQTMSDNQLEIEKLKMQIAVKEKLILNFLNELKKNTED